MANEGPRAYDFEPEFNEEELLQMMLGERRERGEANVVADEMAPDVVQEPNRLNDVNWCQCTNCAGMPSLSECRCCLETQNVNLLIADNGCITQHEDFGTVCLNKAVLRTVLIMRNDVRGHNVDVDRDLDNKSYRYSAYRMFTYWVHGRLGKGVRKVVPSCAVRKIRDKFPDPAGQYVGFIHGDNEEVLEVGEVEAI
ncbi:P2X purinoceptor 7 [Holothuria leucospilota]|uniref:P2X purinoceptor 7 n=1 Tax=Holothuria leucospilota TaxID=206669 RepID=A0A9Q1CSF9_HOLLE|nr:P2X purinoceptor 7 [Holothuria leucospilota]